MNAIDMAAGHRLGVVRPEIDHPATGASPGKEGTRRLNGLHRADVIEVTLRRLAATTEARWDRQSS
jgi:hypothetical protein